MNVAGLDNVDVAIVGDGLDSDAAVAQHICAERQAGRLAYDCADRPSPGSECMVCRLKGGAVPGHYCPAKGYLGEWAVCEACGLGEVCGYAVALDNMRTDAPEFAEFESIADPGRTVDVADAAAPSPAAVRQQHPWQAVKDSLSVDNLRTTGARGQRGRIPTRRVVMLPERKTLQPKKQRVASEPVVLRVDIEGQKQPAEKSGAMGEGGWKPRISDEVRNKVRMEFGTVSNGALGRKFGISGVSVGSICKDLRKPGKRRAGKVNSQPPPPASQPSPPVKPVVAAVVEGVVSLSIPAAALDRYWARLPVEDKARIVSAEIMASLNSVG